MSAPKDDDGTNAGSARPAMDVPNDVAPPSTQRRRLWVVALVVLAMCGACGALGGRTAVSIARESYIAITRDLRMPLSDDDTPVAFTVAEGESFHHVAERLEQEGFIRSAWRLELSARATERDRKVQAGVHTLRRTWNAEAILDSLLHADSTDITVTLLEGMRAEEVADALSAAGVVDRSAFLGLVADPTSASRGISVTTATTFTSSTTYTVSVPPIVAARTGLSLEGYLYPDTYRFAPHAGTLAALEKLLVTFAEKAPADLDARAKAVGLGGAAEAVTLASIVQREGVRASELPKIARVYLNRLATPPYILNADPTLQYALGFQSDPPPGTWWKRPLYDADKQVDSPYNSYLRAGLPPGPIASPGLAAIQAVLAPADGPWMYFVASAACDGTHAFAVTYEEHLANVARYTSAGCGP